MHMVGPPQDCRALQVHKCQYTLVHESRLTDSRKERFSLGASKAGQKKYAEAEPLLLEGYQGMLARKDHIDVPDWYHLTRAREWLAQLYRAWGKPEKAAAFQDQNK